MGRFTQRQRAGGGGVSTSSRANLTIVHKTLADTAEFTWDRPIVATAGAVAAAAGISMNGFLVINVTVSSATMLTLQFNGAVSVGQPGIVTAAPPWMLTPLNPASINPT